MKNCPKKAFFDAQRLWGVIQPPPLKTRSWEDPGPPDQVFAEFREKVGNPPPPADGPAGGFGHFFSDFGDRVGWVPGIFLKNWSKQGVPPF